MRKQYVQYVAHTPATTSTTTNVSSTLLTGLLPYDWFTVDVSAAGNTGGTLDVYLQRRVADSAGTTSVWVDWAHVTQVTAGAARKTYSATAQAAQGFTVCGTGTSMALASGSVVGGHPGDTLRIVTKSGAGTSASSAVRVWLTGWQSRD